MSRSPELKEDPMECPLCMEPLEIDDVNFFPCTCGYQICRFCWHRIRTDENGLCPACRKVLKRPEYFGKFGKIHKVVINNSTSYAGSQGPSASAYVTYIRSEDALRAIQCVNNVIVDGRTLKASLGTTKYCSYFLKSMQCPKPDCMYLHELGDEAASFTKEEMQAGKHQEYEQKLLQDLYKVNPNFLQTSACGEKSKSKPNSTQRPNSTNKEGWPSLQSYGKMVNGLTTENRKSPPFLDCLTDSDHMTPDEPDPEQVTDQSTGLPPFPSALEPTSPIDKPSETRSLGNGETISQTSSSDSPSPPPGLTKPSLVMPISVAELTARSPFEGAAAESQSLFSDNSNFRHPNPIPSGLPSFTSSPQGASDWPMTPEPQSLFTSDTIPVSSSTDWQAAFGFGSSAKQQQQDDDLGFDPFDVTRKALADLIEKELSVQEHSPLSPNPSTHQTSLPNGQQRLPHFQHRGLYNSFSLPQHTAARHPWMGLPTRNNLTHLNHTAAHNHFLDVSIPAQHHSTGLGGIPISENNGSMESINVKEWQDGLRALLPNININFGGLPNSTSSSSSTSSVNHIGVPVGTARVSHSLSWESTASWMDPAIITGIPASTGNSLDCLQDDNPPHWLKSLQALTEMDGPPSSSALSQPPHTGLLDAAAHLSLHRAAWAPYLPPSTLTSSQYHSPPPGFQTAFRPPAQTATDILQSAGIDRH
ncbi:CCR4-NOT transcription complex subunit 4 isoform X3 [Myxocyprinus asiaticus]|uniref:CCR4-NOT transcription complex subunit 4 isoform X3 n=1 Tax=Myxocyprinus asiaticus TaxID=70543 RepID=UPI002221CC80|nr:CCR4-NOT transcription complex subunit 4 isoform X3 [Myxocyprinus asiaticus]